MAGRKGLFVDDYLNILLDLPSDYETDKEIEDDVDSECLEMTLTHSIPVIQHLIH